jgi:tripartite-type tricarboxylate transporter receptor subunit TctC
MRTIRVALATLGLVIGASASAQVNDVPVRIVSPFPAGGVGDTMARIMAKSMRAHLDRTVIVENRSGGGAGRLAIQAIKDAPADGTVLLFTPIAQMSVFPHVYDNLGYDPERDFAPISQVATYDMAVAVGAKVPVRTLGELVAWLKANPDQAAYGTPAAGSLPHFLAMHFARHAGVNLRHVAYRGNPQAISDLMGGHLAVFFTSTQDVVEAHKSGRIRVLATSGGRRLAVLGDVPTFAESGYGIRADGWYGIYAPARTPADVLARLNAAVVEAVRTPEFQSRAVALGLVPTGTSAAELARIQKSDSELWGPMIKASGFKPE